MTAVPRQAARAAGKPDANREALRGDIQGLRAVAVLFVIGFHAIGFPRAGLAGVDIFFVVSGFVITSRLLRDAERTGTVSLPHFYARRFQRIVPAALVTLAAVAAAAMLLPSPQRVSVYVDTLWAAVGAGDFRIMLMPDERWGGVHHVSPVVHFWSLGVEEQFYLVWPLVLLLAWEVGRRRGTPRRWLLPAATAAGGLSLLLGAWSAYVDEGTAYFSPIARGWELAAGVVLAILVPQLDRLTHVTRSVLAFGGLGAIEAAAVVWTPDAYPIPAGLVPVAGTAALLAAGTGGTSLVTKFLDSPVLRRVGDLSYSLYLWHFPVFFFLLVLEPSGGWNVLAEALVLTFALAWLSYRFVEQPVLRLFRQRSTRETATVDRWWLLKRSPTRV